MTPSDPRERLISEAASLLVSAFEDYNASFGDHTRRAKRRFEQRDRAGMRQDVSQRYALYDQSIEDAIARLEGRLAERLFSRPLWSAIRDGYALKDLARSNIFAGDLLPKNFGVTRSGRVIFYDYDELRLMSECRFRRWPDAGDDLLDLSHEPWFHVGEADVFPEQFHQFMGLPPTCLAALQAKHPELFLPEWWQSVQAQLARGETLDVPPYGSAARLN